ncbi:MAG: FeoB-associated Cys-rich membrane protein [Blautia sp.]|nr:FeoB-associated Cys-rich membrane protein [Blautia sp.]
MNTILGNGIALLLVAGLVLLSLRELWKGHRKGGCGSCAGGCSGCCASCSHQHAGQAKGEIPS